MTDPSGGATIEEAARHYAARNLVQTERCCRAILTQHPHHFDALHLLGVVCVMTDRHAEALDMLLRARSMQPANAQLLLNLGNAYQGLKQQALAVETYQQALSLGPGNPGVLNNLGASLRQIGRTEDAIRCFRDLLDRHPDHAPAHNNLAGALADSDHPEEAVESYRQALAVARPDTPPDRLASIVNGLGKALLDLGRPAEALAACRDLLVRHPEQKALEWNESLALLLCGEFAEGWRKYEARWLVPEHDKPHPEARLLDLAKVAGQRVLITSEQGRGDVIQFARYASLLASRGAEVTLSVYPDLVELMRTIVGVTAVISTEDADPPYDQRTSLLSLPLAFGTELATIPADVPYLSVPTERLAAWQRPPVVAGTPRVGVVWSGSEQSRRRSAMPFGALEPVLHQRGIKFHVLQKEIRQEHRDRLKLCPFASLHDNALHDFADTAGLIMAMDLVITIDTAVAHLAGALGRPVWIMLPFNPDWRWLLKRDDSPWYPTARLFRQTSRGDWASVVQRVVTALDTVRFPFPS